MFSQSLILPSQTGIVSRSYSLLHISFLLSFFFLLLSLLSTAANGLYCLDVCQMEGQIPHLYGQSAIEIPGGRQLLVSLGEMVIPHCIVTSGTNALVTGWLEILKLPRPNHLVVAEDVSKGKPDPTCYLKGQLKLSGIKAVSDKDFLVVEDAPAGIRAGRAAGFKVVALTTTHTIEQVQDAGADWIIDDLRDLTVFDRDENNRVRISFDNVRFCKNKSDII
jgi:glycerol 3-phosphatase-1